MKPKSEYAKKLMDPRWQKMRLEVFERDLFTCQMCGDEKSTLNVHHRYYVFPKDPWDYPLTALVTLCQPCHEVESETIKEYCSDLLLILKSGGAMSDAMVSLATAFVETHNTQLVNADWAILGFAIGELLRSHGGDRNAWSAVEEAYYASLKSRKPDGEA